MTTKRRRPSSSVGVWERCAAATVASEAEVEHKLVVPLLRELGHANSDIHPKFPVTFYTGRRGRPHEADYVVFSGEPHDRETSLIVVETKSTAEELDVALNQVESYCFWLRAPFYMATNGVTIEVWQIQRTAESEKIVSFPVADLPAHRGEIERLLQREAILDYCEKLEIKPVRVDQVDVGDYLSAVVRQLQDQQWVSVERSLTKGVAPVGLSDVNEAFPRGCIVAAESGAGKTGLLAEIALGAVDDATLMESPRVPVYIDLPDVVALGVSIAEYAQQRVSARVPALAGMGAFRDYLRGGNLVLLCDSLDNVEVRSRLRIEAELRTLYFDTESQLFVASLPGNPPTIGGLPVVGLSPLSHEAIVQLGTERHGMDAAHVRAMLYGMPSVLRRHSGSPLVTVRLLQHLKQQGEWPQDIGALFDWWVRELVRADGAGASEVSERLRFLTDLANAAGQEILATSAVRELVDETAAGGLLELLIAMGVLEESPAGIRFVHSSVGDYLRAKSLVGTWRAAPGLREPQLAWERGSLFPTFVASQLETLEQHDAFWSHLADTDLPGYLEALRSRADLTGAVQELSDEDYERWFLEQLLEGRDHVVTRWFARVRRSLVPYRDEPAERDSNAVSGIRGKVSRHPRVGYQFFVARAGDDRVIVGTPSHETGPRVHFHDLHLSGMRADDPRVVGIRELARELEKLAQQQRIDGGREWARERLPGRLLRHGFTLSEPKVRTVGDVRELLHGLEEDWIGQRSYSVPVSELLFDINTSGASDEDALASWLLPEPDLQLAATGHWTESYSDELLCVLVKKQFERIVSCYREVVEESLSEVRHDLYHYPQWPIRYTVTLARRDGPMGRAAHAIADWEPVRTWEQATVHADWGELRNRWRTDEEVEQLREKLAGLGRPYSNFTLSGGFRLKREYQPGESYVLHEVGQMLVKDLRHLFRSVRY